MKVLQVSPKSEKSLLDDLSFRGHRIFTDTPFELGDRCVLTYNGTLDSKQVDVLCYVVGRSTHHSEWCLPNVTVKPYGNGCMVVYRRILDLRFS